MIRNNWIKQYAIALFIILAIYFIVNFSYSYDDDFEEAVSFVFKWEGGYVNDPNDPGGETKYGISKKSYPNEDIKNMTIERAKKIYYENYWLKAGCDGLSEPFDIIVFDTAVNCGVMKAKKILEISVDWRDYLLRRIAFYSKLGIAKYYMRGWTNRVVNLYEQIEEGE